jgi:hypothetical protein
MKKKMRIFVVYLDDGENVYKIHVPAYTKKEAELYCQGNGEIVKSVDVTSDYPISINDLHNALKAKFGQTEIDIIMRTITQTLENIIDY